MHNQSRGVTLAEPLTNRLCSHSNMPHTPQDPAFCTDMPHTICIFSTKRHKHRGNKKKNPTTITALWQPEEFFLGWLSRVKCMEGCFGLPFLFCIYYRCIVIQVTLVCFWGLQDLCCCHLAMPDYESLMKSLTNNSSSFHRNCGLCL